MPRNVALYAVTSGLSGCYMPDSHHGAFMFCSRREMADFIRQELEYQDFPACAFAQVRIRRLWYFISRNGSSTAHFSITHNGREIAFHGLTEEEFSQASAED